MAKRLIDWNLKGSSLEMGKYIDSETPATPLEVFDLKKLFPDFEKMTEIQQFLVVYGLKQKLADCGSAEKSAKEKAELAKKLWDLFEQGIIRGKRVNSSENQELKALGKKIKETCKVVSLEGLMTKKLAFPETFTEEDQEKLDGFLQIVAEHSAKQAKKTSKK